MTVDFGQFGVLVDLAGGRERMRLDRATYQVEQTPFPMAFVRMDGRWALAHATDWNRLDLTDAATGVRLTPREFPAVEGERSPPHSLDYFHGALHPSPDGRWIVSDGWVWHPVGIPRLWDLRRWRHDDVFEAEDGESVRQLRFVDYHWNVPMCWLDESRLAIGGIGCDDLAMIPGVEIFDAESGERVGRFAGPTGPLHCDGTRLYASAPDGLEVWDPETGERTGCVPGFTPTHHHRGGRQLAAVDEGALVLWQIPAESA